MTLMHNLEVNHNDNAYGIESPVKEHANNDLFNLPCASCFT